MKAYGTGIKVDMDSITKGPTIKKLIDTGHLTNIKRKVNYVFATSSVNAVPTGINERRFMINKESKPMKATPFNLMKIMAAGYMVGSGFIVFCQWWMN